MGNNSLPLIDLGRGFSIALGLPRLKTWNSNTRPVRVKEGTVGFNTDTNSIEYFNGQVWYFASLTKAA